jgi:hypothetical protein
MPVALGSLGGESEYGHQFSPHQHLQYHEYAPPPIYHPIPDPYFRLIYGYNIYTHHINISKYIKPDHKNKKPRYVAENPWN